MSNSQDVEKCSIDLFSLFSEAANNSSIFQHTSSVMDFMMRKKKGNNEKDIKVDLEALKTQSVEYALQYLISLDNAFSSVMYGLSDGTVAGIIELDQWRVELTSTRRFYKEDSKFKQKDKIIICNIDTKQMVVYKSTDGFVFTDMSQSSAVDNGIIDIDSSGCLWEGGIRKAVPYGYGCFYEGDGRMAYRGFATKYGYVGYGTVYYTDTEMIEYSGSFYNGNKHGHGISYDKHSSITYSGEWILGNTSSSYDISDDINVNAFSIEKLSIQNASYTNVSHLIFAPSRWLVNLKSISIGEGCFSHCRHFVVDSLIQLNYLEVGKGSFQTNCKVAGTGHCIIQNCPNLLSINIQNDCFQQFSHFILKSLGSLYSLNMGNRCFIWSGNFEIRGNAFGIVFTVDIPNLHKISLGSRSFEDCQQIVLESNHNYSSNTKLIPRSPLSYYSYAWT